MLPFSHMLLMLRVPPEGISAIGDLGDLTSLFPWKQKYRFTFTCALFDNIYIKSKVTHNLPNYDSTSVTLFRA